MQANVKREPACFKFLCPAFSGPESGIRIGRGHLALFSTAFLAYPWQTMPRSFFVANPAELQDFLLSALPEVKRTRLKQWLKYGAVLVNGQPQTRHDHALLPGDNVEIRTKEESLAASLLPASLKVVHEDGSLLIIDKPAGLLSIASLAERENTAYAILTEYVRHGNPRSPARVWIVHRLDQETSGLMVFARTQTVKAALQQDWDAVEKRYLAVVEGRLPQDAGTFKSFLDERNPHHVRSVPKSEHSRLAVTHYRVVSQMAKLSLVELTLVTGRRHQIRVQLSDAGCPVAGDKKYGARTDPAKRLALHACYLRLTHPDSGQPVEYQSPLPHVLARLAG